MKLRRLTLTNVRRFGGQRATLGPFGDGLTTITAENEAGKSTFFDALHALFFAGHTSKTAEIRALQPYSGGAVSVAAELEIDTRAYCIEKTFLSQASARITDMATGQVIKQQGDAEQWIEAQINSTRKGPAGLLWVRQGDAHVDPEGRGKDADNIAARRDLMSSVRGQIDAVTGGRRMDKIMEQCRKEFDELSSLNFKPKAKSDWKRIEDDVARLGEQQEVLQKKVAQLAQALSVKAQATRRLRELRDAAKHAERAAQIKAATDALAKAQQHADRVSKADQNLQLAVAGQDKIAREIKEITDARAARARIAAKKAETQEQVAAATAQRAVAEADLSKTQTTIAEHEAARRRLQQAQSAARDGQAQALKWHRLGHIVDLLRQIEAPVQKQTAAQQVLAGPAVAQSDIDQITALQQQISIATEQRRAHFASLRLEPTGKSVARINGDDADASPILIDRVLTVDIEGFGAVHLAPAKDAGLHIEDPKVLRAILNDTLQRLGFPSLQAAQVALAARTLAERDMQIARAEIRALAPDGLEALKVEHADLCTRLDHTPGAPLPEAPSADPTQDTDAALAQIERDLEDLRAQAAGQQQALTDATSAVATAQGVLTHLSEEGQATVAEPDEDARLNTLQAQLAKATDQVGEAKAALAGLQQDGPNLSEAQTTFDRLNSAAQADRDEVETLRRELARVDGAIEAQSEGAVEENLAAATEALEKAQQRSARYGKEARALRLLMDHLDAARKDAQETYFEPIRQELHPLLAQLHAGAAFELDPEKMLVDKIIRGGVSDDVSALSGGAYEQIAILTRLAFARLFAKQGRHVPVILDDALVHTDDARIETMFNMLSQAAKEQQIIVLSCRTRAFSEMGGTRAFIEVADI